LEEQDWEVFDKFRKEPAAVEQMLDQTNTPEAPWFVVDGSNGRFRDLTVAEIVRDRVQARLAKPPKQAAAKKAKEEFEDLLGKVDLSQALEKEDYKKQLAKQQRRFHGLVRDAHARGISTVLAFEGWDAGGKGGNIRRLTSALPARSYKVIPIAAPTEEERVRHYLWRFWRHMPPAGNLVIFDRTWYGRVTVERIEGFAKPQEWQRAYGEINDFEEQLAERGMVVLKFWLHISQEEQLARFQAREKTSYKKYKITEEDYRNRAKWDDYLLAVNEMIAKTDTANAPWHIVPANNKYFARIFVLKAVSDALAKAIKKADKK
jgi:polyphosphate kinase 2 (PPK2 family)